MLCRNAKKIRILIMLFLRTCLLMHDECQCIVPPLVSLQISLFTRAREGVDLHAIIIIWSLAMRLAECSHEYLNEHSVAHINLIFAALHTAAAAGQILFLLFSYEKTLAANG